jgi:hypothetical protein
MVSGDTPTRQPPLISQQDQLLPCASRSHAFATRSQDRRTDHDHRHRRNRRPLSGTHPGEREAIILASNGAYDGPTTLTAKSALTFEEVAQVASELVGRTIQLVVMDPDEWVAAQIVAGQPEFVARFTLSMYQAAHEGYFSGVDPLLGTLLGREPRTVRDVLAPPTPD